jgi:hypothetical protein
MRETAVEAVNYILDQTFFCSGIGTRVAIVDGYLQNSIGVFRQAIERILSK